MSEIILQKGFKPSYFQARNDEGDNTPEKEENIQRYSNKVRAGLPLFEEENKSQVKIALLTTK